MLLQAPLVHDPPGLQSGAQVPVVADFGAQSRFHSQESTLVGSQAAPGAPWPFLPVQMPKSVLVASKASHSQT